MGIRVPGGKGGMSSRSITVRSARLNTGGRQLRLGGRRACGRVGQVSALGLVVAAKRRDSMARRPGTAVHIHTARRVECAVGCLAERDAVRRASHSRNCGGPGGTPAGRHDRWNRERSRRKPPAREKCPRPSVARRASRGVEAPHSALGAQVTPQKIQSHSTNCRTLAAIARPAESRAIPNRAAAAATAHDRGPRRRQDRARSAAARLPPARQSVPRRARRR